MSKEAKVCKVGGQALFDGIMMRGEKKAAMAVRKKDGSIHVEEWTLKEKKWYQKALFIRGVFNFVLQMGDGYRYMMKSAEISGAFDEEEDENATPSKLEKWIDEKLGDKLMSFIMVLGVILGVALALLLFMFLPTWLFTAFKSLFHTVDLTMWRSFFEGIIKIVIFVLYIALTALMKDIHKTYQYHGAEHKTIFAYERGAELIPENVKKYKRFHPRCGTSFIFLTLAISILVYSVLPINSEIFVELWGVSPFIADIIRALLKLVFLPVLIGISYEVLKLAGKYDKNVFMKAISAPGMAIQRLTTKEPDMKQIEVALAAFLPVVNSDE